MLKKYPIALFLCLLFIFQLHTGYGQSKLIDSLNGVIATSKVDSIRGDAYFKRGNLSTDVASMSLSYDSAIFFYKQDNALTKAFNTYINKGSMSFNLGELDTLKKVIEEVNDLYANEKSLQKPENEARLFALKGFYHDLQSDHKVAVEYYLKAKDQYVAVGNIEAAGNVCKIIATMFANNRQYEKGYEYTNMAITYNKQVKDSAELYNNLLNLAALRSNLEQYDKLKAILDEAKPYIPNAATPDMVATYYKIEARYYLEVKKDYNLAEGSFKNALAYVNTDNYYDKAEKADIYELLSETYLEQNKLDFAISTSKKSLALYKEIEMPSEYVNNYNILSNAYVKKGQYALAHAYLDSAYTMSDSLYKQKLKDELLATERKYDVKQKNIEIATLKNENAAQRKIKLQYAILAIVTLLSSVILYLYLQNRRRLHKQFTTLQQQQIVQLEKEKQMASLEYLIKGQEEERVRVAMDLHDGLGGMLSGVKLSLSQITPTDEHSKLVNTISQLDRSINELRHIAHNMMPDALLRFGLNEALSNFCASLKHVKDINISYQSYGWKGSIEKNKEVVLYRIAQELINNTIKHAQAKNILVQLIEDENRISLTVEDDGIGYIAKENIHAKGIGMSNIESRVQFLNGNWDIQSEKGTGTTISVEFKIN
jgi:two-component system, NarL family, sensor kinase